MSQQPSIVKTVLSRVNYRNETGWGVYQTDHGKMVGVVSWEPRVGDRMKFEGQWEKSKFNGQDQFVFKTASLDIPDDSRGMLAYAVSCCKGLGSSKEAAIWEKYGEKWKEAVPLDLPGVGQETEWHWEDTLNRLKEQEVMTKTLAFLMAHGCTMNMSLVAWKEWETDAYGKVAADCYCLADLPHYGFSAVDNGIRQMFEVGDHDMRRIRAAVLYAIEQGTADGSTVLAAGGVFKAVMALVGDVTAVLDQAIADLQAAGKVWLESGLIALASDVANEKAIWERVGA